MIERYAHVEEELRIPNAWLVEPVINYNQKQASTTMYEQARPFDPQLYDPSYNPTEPYRPWSARTFVSRIVGALCVVWIGWLNVGAHYFANICLQNGVAALQAGHDQQAVEQFTGMTRLEPNDYRGYELRAQAYHHLEDFQAEIADDTRALALLNGAADPGAAAARRDVSVARDMAQGSVQP
jgi:hypothetical protein